MANKGDIVDCVVNSVEGLTKKLAGEAVDAIFECITNSLADDERVQIPGFGTFLVSHRAARQGRNPQTGKPMKIRASNNVRFKAGKAVKDAVN